MIGFTINGRHVELDLDPQTPLLWAIRDEIGLRGTKYGCGEGLCGACTVHVGGEATRSCITTIGDVDGAEITTIEGLEGKHPVQKVWAELQVPQCGYCQSGQIMSAAAMLKHNPDPSDDDIDAVMTGNLCRCMTYNRIRDAVRQAAAAMRAQGEGENN